MKLTSTLLLLATATVSAVTRQECKDDYLPGVLDCIDASTGKVDCPYLPIPDFAFPQNMANDMGYWLQHLRNTPTSHVFAISENNYVSMIVVDVPPAERRNLRRVLLEEEAFEGGPMEMSEDEEMAMMEGITFAFVDFPPTFETGPESSHLISGMMDILGLLGATMDDVVKVEMIYTHGHMDHIGLANQTYTYFTETMGMAPSMVPVIATEGVKDQFEHAIEAGLFSYRAAMPTVTYDGYMEHTVGQSTMLSMTTFDGHTYGDKDVVVFMEALDEENPAIMMVVDVVFPKWVPFFSFAITTDVLEYITAHYLLLDFPLGDDGYLIAGHLNQVGDRNDIALNRDLTNAILEGAAMALETVDLFSVVGPTGAFTPDSVNVGNSWLAFGAYFDELQRVCARAVLEQYGCDFGALDVTIYSHCNMAQSFWRVDA